MGQVYEAVQESLDRRVAIKVLNPGLAKNAEFVRRFEREATALAKLQHPFIVTVLDRGQVGDVLYFVMEYVESRAGGVQTLADLLRAGPTSERRALRFLRQIAQALHHAHEAGIVHRDVKPSNVLIDKNGAGRLADFGIAHVAPTVGSSDTMLTVSGVAIGTPTYMAPEQKVSGSNLTPRADIYALGVIAYQALTGELPEGVFPLPTQVNASLNPGWNAIVTRAMRKDPSERHKSALDFLRDLKLIQDALQFTPATPAASPVEALPVAEVVEGSPSNLVGVPQGGPIITPSTPSPALLCPRCQTSVDPALQFCPSCGLALQAPCPSCGQPMFVGVTFCAACGTNVVEHRARQEALRSKCIAAEEALKAASERMCPTTKAVRVLVPFLEPQREPELEDLRTRAETLLNGLVHGLLVRGDMQTVQAISSRTDVMTTPWGMALEDRVRGLQAALDDLKASANKGLWEKASAAWDVACRHADERSRLLDPYRKRILEYRRREEGRRRETLRRRRERRLKTALWSLAGVVVLLLTACVLFGEIVPRSRDREAYREALSVALDRNQTVEARRRALAEYMGREGRQGYATEVTRYIRDFDAFQAVSAAASDPLLSPDDRVAALDRYLRQYPAGLFKDEVSELRRSLLTNKAVSVAASPSEGGQVSGGGEYEHGSVATLTASPNDGWRFLGWSDGVGEATRTLVIKQTTQLTARFGRVRHMVTGVASPAEGGSVSGAGEYGHGEAAALWASANDGWRFVGWADGVTQTTRTVDVTGPVTYTARFERAGPPTAGTVTTVDLGRDVTMRLAWIPSGTFMMGSPESESGRERGERQHQVTLTRGFWMGVTEVTQAQWEAVMGSNPSHFRGANRPVEQVSWEDCQEFVQGLSQRTGQTFDLPTEAEWEYACRAGSQTAYHFGDSESELENYAWYNTNSNSQTSEVGQKRANGWGLYDMHGNVWEWCRDWYGEYQSGSVTGPTGPTSGESRVLRGGAANIHPRLLRAAYRGSVTPTTRGNILGVRVVRRGLPETLSDAVARHRVTVAAEPAEGGSVTPVSGEHESGTYLTLMATANEGWRFTEWSDGVSQATRTVDVTGPVTYTARFERAAPPVAGTVTTVDLGGGVTMRLAWIPPGTFMMGSPESRSGRESDERQHQVRLTRGFWMGVTEVTQAQWEAVMGSNPSHFRGANRPVEQVSWDDCEGFIRRLSQRTGQTFDLPTEAEWEYACQAGTRTMYSFGNSERELANYAWYRANSDDQTHDVGRKRATAWGLYDMHGNVWEWCRDWYGEYQSGSVTDPTGPTSGESRVRRGGAMDDDPGTLRAAYRGWVRPTIRLNRYGLRVVRRGLPETLSDAVARYRVTVAAEPAEGGSVTPVSGEHESGTYLTLMATANEGWRFTEWSDGVSQATRTVDVTGPATYTARFERAGPLRAGTSTTVELGGGVRMELVWIPPGTFTMGSPAGESGRDSDETQHQVTLTRGFWMGATEVTQRQWQAVMETDPSYFKGANRPVEMVSWDDCEGFTRRLSQRTGQTFDLPTEAEWEYACRAEATTAFCFGNASGDLEEYAWYDANSGGQTHDVGQKRSNAWGLHDMHGNVEEWCKDRALEYPPGPLTDPQGPESGQSRVLRGGSSGWASRGLRAANRGWVRPTIRLNRYGLRVVRR